MKPSTRIAVGIAIFIAILFAAGLFLYFLPVLDQRFHFLSEPMRRTSTQYQFSLLGLLLLLFASFCGLLEGVWWLGRKLKVPYVVLLLVCVGLIVAAYLLLAHVLKGTIPG
jgi:membrane protease YdiL (CAAX protease family)